MTPIFHYTNADGLLGILKSKALWATHYRYLNDTSEAAVIRSLILPILEEETAKIMPKLAERGLLEGYYEFHGGRADALLAEGQYKSLVRVIDVVSPFYVLSFCKHQLGSPEFKHGLLSQWRGYGAAGGFAIEFDEQQLDELIKNEANHFAYAGIKTGDVLYKNYKGIFDRNRFTGLAGEMIRRLFERQQDTIEITGQANVDKIAVEFSNIAPFLKHRGFREEREYRVMAACIRKSKIPPELKLRHKEINFRQKNGLIVPYIKLLENSDTLPIKSIIVGPHPFQDKQEEALQIVLESLSFDDIRVRRSDIPYVQ
jgi:hypothetical protein